MKDIPADSLIKNYFPVDYIDSFSKVMVTGQALTCLLYTSYHSFFQALVQAAGDFLPTQFPVDVHTYDETVHLGEGTLVYWGMGIILFDFDGSYGTFGCVHVRGIVQAFRCV